MDLKIHMHIEIFIEHQTQKKHKKLKRKIPHSLIQDAQEISWQYLPT